MTQATAAAETSDIVVDMLTRGATLGDAHGIDDKDLETIYHLGHGLYGNGRYEEARQVFGFLSLYNHLEHKYALGLGACCQMLKDYEDAVDAYSRAAILDVEDPRAPMHAAQCFLSLKQPDQAESALHAAVSFAGKNPRWAEIATRANKMLGQLTKRKQEVCA